MHKRTIYYSLGFAAVLVVALGTLNFTTDTQMLRGTLELNNNTSAALEEAASQEAVIASADYCPNVEGASTFIHIGPDPVAALGSTITYNGLQLDEQLNVSVLSFSIGDTRYDFDVNDSYTGFIGMSPVIGDNIGFSDGSISFNSPSALGEFSLHFRYFDFNEAVIEINGTADCLPYRSSVVMLPCEDCKVRTLVNNNPVGLMWNRDHLLITTDNFSGSTIADSPVGVDMSGVEITTEFTSFPEFESINLASDVYDDELGPQRTSVTIVNLQFASSFDQRMPDRKFVVITE